jgi:hypothetical protein
MSSRGERCEEFWPEETAAINAAFPEFSLDDPKRHLIILDLDGTLVHRARSALLRNLLGI